MSEDLPLEREEPKEPQTLSGYLKGDFPASKYLKKLETELGAPGVAESEAALELCFVEPGLIARVVELARLANSERVDSRIRKAIRSWSSEIIRGQAPELQDWAKFGSTSSEGQLNLLAKRLREVRRRSKNSTDASTSSVPAAEQVLRLGLIVTASRPDFDVVASLSSLFDALHPGKLDRSALERTVRKLALGASPKLLESMAALTRLVRSEADPLRTELADTKAHLQASRDKVKDLQEKSQKQAAKIEALNSTIAQLQATLSHAENRIEGVMGGADQDMIVLRARYRTLLKRKLQPNLDEAKDGLQHDPPNVEVARHRIGVAEREVRSELEWLNQFSD